MSQDLKERLNQRLEEQVALYRQTISQLEKLGTEITERQRQGEQLQRTLLTIEGRITTLQETLSELAAEPEPAQPSLPFEGPRKLKSVKAAPEG